MAASAKEAGRPPVGLVAGQGGLPVHLARRLAAAGRAVVLAAMEGAPVDNPDGLPCIRYRVERLGGLFAELRRAGVEELVFAGAVRRPKLDLTALDFTTMRLAPQIMKALKGGDDGTLRAVLAIFEGEGFTVRAAHEIAPELLPPAGVMTVARPSEADRKDAARAARIVEAMSAVDVGQGVVVAQGLALAVEALPGTDAMLAQLAEGGDLRPDPAGARGVLFKGPKLGQDRRVDLPVIGAATVVCAARAGLAGIAVEAGGVMLLDRDRIVAEADAAGLFLWVRRAEAGT